MGVHGLWELLAPVGRRVSVETLAGKRLAIDASIWMIQFMKAMRDEKGEMVRNAHILGFFRRICKLLYLRTKPVFVFDGGTPALKRRTVIARRRQRENAQAKIRKTAEKLLLNQLKTMRLQELAADLEKQRKENNIKGKRPITEEPNNEQETQKVNNDVSSRYSQEELDEMLAASIAAEEDEGFGIGASTSGAAASNNEDLEEDDDEDEEMILPEMDGKVDPAVLAALPPSMQLDLLVQMRERLMAENRQKYQKVKKAPARFSELQIESYLKTVAFRREIDGVQKAAAGGGIGGLQTSRIASEANREFIFSSSFTGDKEVLTSVGQERDGADGSQAQPVNSSANAVNKVQETRRSDATTGQTLTETGKPFHHDVETYVDDRGRVRVSRLRALGIRMTRDLQRNLDLMKEIDQGGTENHQKKDIDSATARNSVDVLDNPSGRTQHQEASNKNNDGMDTEGDKPEEPVLGNGAPIEISFEDTLEHDKYGDSDDKLFACLVAGDPVVDLPIDKSATAKESLPSDSDNEWEEGVIEGKSTEYLHEGSMTDDGQVEWEEGFQGIQLKSSSCPDESQKNITKGALEEEAAFQEAIQRSLEDSRGSPNDFHENHPSERARVTASDDEEVEWEEGLQEIRLKLLSCPDESQETVTNGTVEEDAAFQEAIRRSLENTRGSMDDAHENCTFERARGTVGVKSDYVSACEVKEQPDVETLANDVREQFGSMSGLDTICSEANSADKSSLELKLLNQDADKSGALAETHVPSDALPGEKGLHMSKNQPPDTFSEDGYGLAMNKLVASEKVAHNSSTSEYSSAVTDSLHDRSLNCNSADAQNTLQAEYADHLRDTEKIGKTSADDSVTDIDDSKHFSKDKTDGNISREKDGVMKNDNKEQEIMEDDLEEVMMFLDKEREELGSEQRKLERNAESVNNEMFVECQELLQMFGLPYIIAPMEAEAQCAFLELSNQVDGVVTDDSDAFLFGAQSVYKNIFDDRKYVETYLMKDIENELGLDREKLIHMALLLGSDYTEGISGIGIVNAIEVVNAFAGREGLREFREWIESPDPSILGKLDVGGGNSRKKGSKSDSNSKVEEILCDQNVPQPVDGDGRKKQIFKDKHRNVSKNWHISSSFPSDAVILAYASPQVDKSTEPFSWGKPDLFVLRKLCWEKFGWGTSKADELLLPVLKEYNKHETQLRLEAFYTFNERFAKIRSKRIEKAVKGITGSKSSDVMNETPQQSRSGRKRKAKPREDEGNQSGLDSTGLDGAGTSTQNDTVEKSTVKQSKRGRTKEKNPQGNLEQSTCVDGHVIKNDSNVKGRQRGRGRRQQSGRGKRKNNPCADAEINDDSCSEHDEEMHNVSGAAHQIRRSGRNRKTVNYTLSDESDNNDEDDTFIKENVMAEESVVDQEFGGTDKSNGSPLNEGGDVGMADKFLVAEETKQSTHKTTDMVSTSMIDAGQMYDPSNQGEASKYYLQSGGGFCLDEDEEKEPNENESSPTGEKVPEESDVLAGVNSGVEENQESDPLVIRPGSLNRKAGLSDNKLNTKDASLRGDSPDDIHNDSENCSSNFLRAMPNLRRKKRKY